jgi:S-adenosylmethionine synthetase
MPETAIPQYDTVCAFTFFSSSAIAARMEVGEAMLTELVRKIFALTPKGIIDSLNLRRPIYQKTAAAK